MKKIIYNLIKFWIRTSLHLYFGKIEISGLENVPKSNPVLFLPNHQNALLDPLLIAVGCNRKPYFLTRSDVFKTSFLNWLFALVRMIPIYRIRDGRSTLKNNDEVFNRCAMLLKNNESLLMFPEANHNLQRRVRPLSKGFTRILFKTIALEPDNDIQIVPVGLNYKSAESFPDKVVIIFGQPIGLQSLLIKNNERATVENIKQKVATALKKLTTHVPEENYAKTIADLKTLNVDFLKPKQINDLIKNPNNLMIAKKSKLENKSFRKIIFPLFIILNAPVVALWEFWLKPKVWEVEFTATLRFGLALLVFPLYYLLLFVVLNYFFTASLAFMVIALIVLVNYVYVKYS